MDLMEGVVEGVGYETLEVKLSKDLIASAKLLEPHEVRYLVDMYYQIQDYRIRAAGQTRSQIRAAAKDVTGETSPEPHALVSWSSNIFQRMEAQVKPVMHAFAKGQRPGRWLLSIHGIGPILAAGFLAHIDIEKAPYAGNIWSFAGLDPTVEWKPKTKRPWNARLKVLCWKAGQSFMKLRGYDNDIYGKVYEQRKAEEVTANEAGQYAELAALALKRKNFRKNQTRAHYEAGHLPPAHIDARARRYAVKLFLAHLHHVMYECHFEKEPPTPYVLTLDGHNRYVPPPLWPAE